MTFAARPAHAVLAILTLAALLVAGGASGATRQTGKKTLEVAELSRFSSNATDADSARTIANRLEEFLAAPADSTYVPIARIILVQALMTVRAPLPEFTTEAKRAIALMPDRPEAKASFYGSIATHLADRGEGLELALGYADQALKACPDEPQYRGLRGMARSAQGLIQLQLGQTAAAIASLDRAVPDSPDSQRVLFRLGQAYEKAGKADAAIAAYVRSLGVFAASDTSAAAPMRAVYLKRNGSLAGLDPKIEAARRASRNLVALEGRRHEAPAPDWSLPDLDGKKVELASLKGKVVVLDFWGSWCGPCRMELPYFQALYERYRGSKDVAVLSLNWERAQTTEEHVRTAREYMKQNKFSFPVVYDHEQTAVRSYGLQGFPTVFLIDRSGKIRYRNVGFDPVIDDILEAQIQSLLE